MTIKEQLIQELTDWFQRRTQDDVEAVVPKAIEYGSRDLVEMGRQLARVRGLEVTDAEAAEDACWFYTLGKMGRWNAALERGDRVSDDTLHDIQMYIRMVQRIRETGAWPGTASATDPEFDDLGPMATVPGAKGTHRRVHDPQCARTHSWAQNCNRR